MLNLFRRLCVFAAVALSLSACADWLSPWRILPDAVQVFYRDFVPHTNASGSFEQDFDADSSFFPIGLYHTLAGHHFGKFYDLSEIRTAGFNVVHPWEGQDPIKFLEAAAAQNLKVLPHWPKEELIQNPLSQNSVLAWYLDEEPSQLYRPEIAPEKLATFQTQAQKIKALDPKRALLVIDDRPGGSPERQMMWDQWAQTGDVSSHFNYPLLMDRNAPKTLSTSNGIPRSVKRAIGLNNQKKPMWLVVQAFASPRHHRRMPTPTELRAMVFAGLVSGATGIIYFGFDSFVMRDGDVWAMAPHPVSDYGATPDYDGKKNSHLVIDQEQIEQSTALWQAAAAINKELSDLSPYLLSPTIDPAVQISIKGRAISPNPIRILAKSYQGNRLWIVVNLDGVPLELKVEGTIPHDQVLAANMGENHWTDWFEPYEVKIYRWAKS